MTRSQTFSIISPIISSISIALLSLFLVSACSTKKKASTEMVEVKKIKKTTAQLTVREENADVPIETIPFTIGVSSTTVERLAKQQSCESKLGAGLLFSDGPRERYRVSCEDGRVLLAVCELRQCRIASTPNDTKS
jgi:hypothetical protein